MTAKQFYDWQTAGGTDDVMRLVDCLEPFRPTSLKDLADIARPVEAHPDLWDSLPDVLKQQVQRPPAI